MKRILARFSLSIFCLTLLATHATAEPPWRQIRPGPAPPPAQFQECAELDGAVAATASAGPRAEGRSKRVCNPNPRFAMPVAWISAVELLNCSWAQGVEQCDSLIRHDGGKNQPLTTEDRSIVSSLHQFTGLELASPLSRADLEIRRRTGVNRIVYTMETEQAQWLAGLHLQSANANPGSLEFNYSGTITRADGRPLADNSPADSARLLLPKGYDLGLYSELPQLSARSIQGGGTHLSMQVTLSYKGEGEIRRLPEITPVFTQPSSYIAIARPADLLGLRSQLPDSEVMLVRDRLVGTSWSAPPAFVQDAAGTSAGQLAPNVLVTSLAPGEEVTEEFWLVLRNAAQAPLFRLSYRDPHDGALKIIYGGPAVQDHAQAGQHSACVANPTNFVEQYCKISLQGRTPLDTGLQTIPINFEPLHAQPNGYQAADGAALRTYGAYVAAVIIRSTELDSSGDGIGGMRLLAGDSGRSTVSQMDGKWLLTLATRQHNEARLADVHVQLGVGAPLRGRDDLLLVSRIDGWRMLPGAASDLTATLTADTLELPPPGQALDLPLRLETVNPAVETGMPRLLRIAVIARDVYQRNLQNSESNLLRGALFSSMVTVSFDNGEPADLADVQISRVRLPSLAQCIAGHKDESATVLLANDRGAGMDLNNVELDIQFARGNLRLPLNAQGDWLLDNPTAWRKPHVRLDLPVCDNPDYLALLGNGRDWRYTGEAKLCRGDTCTASAHAAPHVDIHYALNKLLDCANLDALLDEPQLSAQQLQGWQLDDACSAQLPAHGQADQDNRETAEKAARILSTLDQQLSGFVATLPSDTVITRPPSTSWVPFTPAEWRDDQQRALAIATQINDVVAGPGSEDSSANRPSAGATAGRSDSDLSCSISAVSPPPGQWLPPILQLRSRITCNLSVDERSGFDGCPNSQAGEFLQDTTLVSITLDLALSFANKASAGLATTQAGQTQGRQTGGAQDAGGSGEAKYSFADLSMTLGATAVTTQNHRIYEVDRWNAPPGQDPARCRQAQYTGSGASLTLNAAASLEKLLDLSSGLSAQRLRQLASGPLLAADALKSVSVSAGWSENSGSQDMPLHIQLAADGYRIEGDMHREQAYTVSRMNASFSPGSSAGFGFSHIDDKTRYRNRTWLVRGAPWPLCYVWPGNDGASSSCNRSQWAQQEHSQQSGSVSVTWNPASILKTVVNNVVSEAGKATNWNSVIRGLDNSSCAVGCIDGSWVQQQSTSLTNRLCRSENSSYHYNIGLYPGTSADGYEFKDVEACAAGLRLGSQPFASMEWDDFALHQPEHSSYRVRHTGPVIDLVAVPECFESRSQMQLVRCQCGPIGSEGSCEFEQTDAGASVTGGNSRAVIDLCDFGIGNYFSAPGTLAEHGGARLRMKSMWRESAGPPIVSTMSCY